MTDARTAADAPADGGFLLVAHFASAAARHSGETVSAAGTDGFDVHEQTQAAEALAVLAAAPDCTWLRYAASTEDPGRAVLVAQFASAAAYRRALGPMPARLVLVPWLSTALPGTAAVHEIIAAAGFDPGDQAPVDRDLVEGKAASGASTRLRWSTPIVGSAGGTPDGR